MKLNKKTIAVSAATLVIIGGTSAFAWFSVTGSGTGTGSVGDPTPTITVVSATASAIEELDVAEDVDVELTADKNGAHINTIDIAVDASSSFWNNTTCQAGWFSTTSASALDTTVPKNTDTPSTVTLEGGNLPAGSTGDLTLTLESADADQSGCIGLDNIPLTIAVS